MNSLLLTIFDELATGLLGKVIGIGLIFSVAKTTISQAVRFPDPEKLKAYGVKLQPNASSKIGSAKKRHFRLTLVAWALLPAYFAIRWIVVAAVPEEATVVGGWAAVGICALALIPITSLFLTYYLAATETIARDLAQFGRV